MISTRARLTIVLLLLVVPITYVPVAAAQTFDWNSWRRLPVLDGGRLKPFETLAREKSRATSGYVQTVDPETGDCLDACALQLGMLFDWYGWDRVGQPAESNGQGSLHIPYPDKWDRMPLLRVDFLPLRSALGLKPEQRHISPLELSQSKIRLPDNGEDTPLLIWTATLASREQQQLKPLEQQALDLAGRFRAYQDWRAGRQLMVVPQPVKTEPASPDQPWYSLSVIVGGKWDDTSDTTGGLRSLQKQFREARTAYLQGSAAEFRQASAGMLQTAAQIGPQWGSYPAATKISWEIAYNHWAPFRSAWLLMLCATVALLLAIRTTKKNLYWAGWLAFAAGLLAVLVGVGMRTVIMGCVPVCNMYESVIFAAVGIAMLGCICELLYRQKYVLTVAAAVATVVLLLADSFPGVLDPNLRSLQPVLRSNFWLALHVLTITLSFAALALAWGTGNVTLGYFLTESDNQPPVETLAHFTHRCVSAGVLLLVAGTILGAAWADRTWGRFWSWDPKEVWTLITLLGYLAVLQACATGRLRRFGLAASSVSGFALVVMAWYGVNFVLGAGLHSYGFGSGGEKYVLLALAAQFLYVAIATVRHYRWQSIDRRRREFVGGISG